MKDKLRKQLDIRARRIGSLRMSILLLLFIAAVLFIAVRLAYMQINESRYYSELSRRNSLRRIPIPAVRAPIVDRNGELLAVDVPRYRLVRLKENGLWEARSIEFEEASRLEENGTAPGEYVEAVPVRSYPAGESAAHITGYVGEISASELKRWRQVGYRLGDRAGKSGLERWYELRLTGYRGKLR